MQARESNNIRSLSTTIELVLNARDLSTLDAIGRTVDEMNEHRSLLRFHTAIIRKEINDLREFPEQIDVDGTLVRRLEELRDKIGVIHALLVSRCNAVQECEGHDDDVVDALSETIDVTADMHNAMNDLCWAVGEHDADFDKPTGKKYANLEEMFADLDS